MEEDNVYFKGSETSLIEYFEINGLHGYRDVAIDSPYSATILIAQNGAGKTTLLNAMDAFLKAQFLRLRELKFSEIRCKLRNVPDCLVLTYADIQALSDITSSGEFAKFANKIEVDSETLVNFVAYDFDSSKESIRDFRDDRVFEMAVRHFDYNSPETLEYFKYLQNELYSVNDNLSYLSNVIKETLAEYEILYLPTYRRIETPLNEGFRSDRIRPKRRNRIRMMSSIFSKDIQFGLSDISERLYDLNQEILFESNKGYRKISADIIKELVDGTFASTEYDASSLPSDDDLNLFFSRLKEGRRSNIYSEASLPNIEDFSKVNTPDSESNRFLRYFLGKLNTVMQATKGIEAQVEDFILKCNNYLSSSEGVYETGGSDSINVLDNKELILNRKNLSVSAESIPTGRRITLDALSSGEKQMISLFAKLYLYPKKKIVLIDEPELSLSLDWQRKILVDVISAPTCNQLVAITHSPFVFDNPLEPFARSIRVSVNETAAEELDSGDDLDLNDGDEL